MNWYHQLRVATHYDNPLDDPDWSLRWPRYVLEAFTTRLPYASDVTRAPDVHFLERSLNYPWLQNRDLEVHLSARGQVFWAIIRLLADTYTGSPNFRVEVMREYPYWESPSQAFSPAEDEKEPSPVWGSLGHGWQGLPHGNHTPDTDPMPPLILPHAAGPDDVVDAVVNAIERHLTESLG
jgi:hypothetical protein